MINIISVLKSGGDFTPEYVDKLYEGVKANLSIPFTFQCFSDMEIHKEWLTPLNKNYEGWWSKVEIFRITDKKCLYLDLDTIINKSLDEIVEYPHKFTMLKDVGNTQRLASGILAWDGDYSFLYSEFTPKHIETFMNYRIGSRGGPWGDGGYIEVTLKDRNIEVQKFQELFPNKIVSHKYQTLPERQAASIICYHGQPRPKQTNWAI